MKKIVCSFSLIAVFVTFGLADVLIDKTPTPKKTKSVDTRLTVRIDRNATEAKLIIPKSQIKQLRAELEDLDEDPDNTARAGFSRSQTILSGIFFSLACIFGGMWFIRSPKSSTKTAKTLIIGSGLFLSGAIATITFANAGPPPDARTLTGKFFSPAVNSYKYGSGKIKLEVSDKISSVELIVPDSPAETKPNSEE